MNYTDNYNLNLPSFNDSANISALNENFSKIDEKLKENADAIGNVKVPTDQTYTPTSENPQSGKAVAEAVVEAVTTAKNEVNTTLDTRFEGAEWYTDVKIGKATRGYFNLEGFVVGSIDRTTGKILSTPKTHLISKKLPGNTNYIFQLYDDVVCDGVLYNTDGTLLQYVEEVVTGDGEEHIFIPEYPIRVAFTISGATDIDNETDLEHIDQKVYFSTNVDGMFKLTYNSTDNTVIEGSTNPVSGGAVYEALQNVEIDVDKKMSSTSTNPVQNKVAKAYVDNKKDLKLSSSDQQIKFNVQDNKLIASIFTKSELDDPFAQLDLVAHEDKTYRDIFVTNNLVPWGDFENGIGSGASINAGNPEITDEMYQSGSKSLKCFGTSSQQMRWSVEEADASKYLACSVKVDRFVKGHLGVRIVANATNYNSTITQTTEGFERASIVVAGSPRWGYIGSLDSANLDGYIDDVVLINLSMFTTQPTKEKMDELYDNYIKIITGQWLDTEEDINASYVIGELESETEPKPDEEITYTDKECISAFMEKVNEKAQELGMINSSFITPSGAGTENLSTSKDLARLFVSATAYNDLVKVWGKDTKIITTKNDTPKSITVETTVINSTLENAYYIFGGKTGSWNVNGTVVYNLGAVGEVAGKLVVGVVMRATAGSNRFVAMKEMFDIAKQVIENPETDTTSMSTTKAESCCCCILPEHNVNMYENYPFNYLFEQDADTQIIPASVTKVITSMVMLDYVKDLDETFEFISSDLIGGSGAVFSAGDIITYKDGLYALMLPSSNMTAQAIARCVGRKILEKS